MKYAWLLLVIFSCQNKNPEPQKIEDGKSAIVNLMSAQETAWNNGDLEAFMKPYWHSKDLRFVGKSGLNKGWQTTLENYKKSYPTQEKMGTLAFNNLEFSPLGNAHYLVIGKWQLFRNTDTLGGHYSLVWKYIDGKWQIIADHSS